MSEKMIKTLADLDIKYLIDRAMTIGLLAAIYFFAKEQGAQWIETQNSLVSAMVQTNADTNNRWTEIRISESERFTDYQMKQVQMLQVMEEDNKLSAEISKTLVDILSRMTRSDERAILESLKLRLHDKTSGSLPDPPDVR